MKKTDLAWAAGFIDGEGSITISIRKGRRSTGHQLHLQVGQAVREPLDRLISIIGGAVYTVGTRGTFMWVMSSGPAADAIRKLRPYMNVKAVEADLALEFQDTYLERGRSTRAVPAALINQRDKLRLAMIKHRNAKYAKSRKIGGAAWEKWQKTRHLKRSL